ncbi:hypothetical protein WK90_22540 [Burkholderia cepacia]|uniref:hypothetical protein n=1 Tax=Burkholderia cepacia TaxID=292 RepID=UPI000759A4FD|nr:hypothetical protein [Burkholderia cepacia]KVS60458.1 hypothetical protein WK41_33970 [Burkholderia cepacia]KVV49064.1 hypothetical protein WK83_01770 [Burkholderia cepacia]KVV66618.1 hypothetical protein WK84_02280 [Burkholderia cepacia]KVV71313.1 hypothetical protein WK85_17260 [Burkholderia cepacia]KVW00083.1 hypothetical protein WK87_03080 [Burkholderia cepacia]
MSSLEVDRAYGETIRIAGWPHQLNEYENARNARAGRPCRLHVSFAVEISTTNEAAPAWRGVARAALTALFAMEIRTQ